MQRRTLFSLPLLASTALATPALSQNRRQVRLITAWPKGLLGPGTSAERLAKRITALSQGALEVTLFGAGEIAPAFGVFDAVSSGVVEMGHSASFFNAGKEAACHYFTSVPFGLLPHEHHAWLEAGGQNLWDNLYAAYNLKPFLGGNTGLSMGGWFKKPLEEVKGLKIRMAGLGGELFTRLGATAIALPPGDIYSSLERGAIDAAEFTSPASDERLGLHKIAPYYYAPGFNKPNGSSELILNKGFYEGLNPFLQQVIQEASRAEQMIAISEMENENQKALTRLVSEGAKLQGFSENFVALARKEALTLRQDLITRTTQTRLIGADYEAFLTKTQTWAKVWGSMLGVR